jgi:hypothetical protein
MELICGLQAPHPAEINSVKIWSLIENLYFLSFATAISTQDDWDQVPVVQLYVFLSTWHHWHYEYSKIEKSSPATYWKFCVNLQEDHDSHFSLSYFYIGNRI